MELSLGLTGVLTCGLILLSTKCEVGTALSCYECVDIENMPDSTVDCDNPGDEQLTACIEGTTECLLFGGVMMRPNGESHAGVARLCGPPPDAALDNQTAHEQKCYCDEEAAYWLKVLIPVIAPDDLIVEGGFCFCNEDGCNRSNSTEDACPHDDDDVPHPTEDGDGGASGCQRALLWLVATGVGLAVFAWR